MSLVETGLSFVEGIALIASPCILPVLPLVLGASVEGGRRRPFGIILGFIFAFSAFALLSRRLVMWLHIDLDAIKYGSLILLAIFGAVMLSEKLSEKFALLSQRLAGAGNVRGGDGVIGGFYIGMLIGLVWTPCAGPILAAVLVQIIRQESDLHALPLLLAFSAGAGLPMLAIALMGRSVLVKFKFLTANAQTVRRAFGVLIILAVAFMAAGGNAQNFFASKETTTLAQNTDGLIDALPRPYPAPEFTGLKSWINTKPLTMASLKGKVVLIDFWTYSCINCVRTLPYLTQWDRAYRDQGLVIVGVHAPEFEFEKDQKNVEAAVAGHNIQYPVALDNNLDTWTAFQNLYWPAHYLIDRNGNVVYTHFGEGNYAETENNIRHLLGLQEKKENTAEESTSTINQSPETYLGYMRANNFVSPEGLKRDAAARYTAPAFIPSSHWALSGAWKVGPENITSTEAGASLRYHFTAGKVFLVLGTDKPQRLTLTLNGKPLPPVTVDRHALYTLVQQADVKDGMLEITAENAGLEAYAFTFGK